MKSIQLFEHSKNYQNATKHCARSTANQYTLVPGGQLRPQLCAEGSHDAAVILVS